MTRLLEVIIDEGALELRLKHPGAMAAQVRHLLALADSPHATVRVILKDAPFYESRGHNFDVLSFAGTTDRIGVRYLPFLGAELAPAACTTSGPASRAPRRPTRPRAGPSSNGT